VASRYVCRYLRAISWDTGIEGTERWDGKADIFPFFPGKKREVSGELRDMGGEALCLCCVSLLWMSV
jgi:hypothetical protein